MKKDKKFLIRLSEQDLEELRDVSQVTKRSKSDVLRWALHQVAISLHEQPEQIKLLKPISLG
jgi:hypothetical protein